MYGLLELVPHAAGPPQYLHYSFDESGMVIQGTFSVKVKGQVMKVSAGEKVLLPRGGLS